ncbi:MAG: 3-hydroxyisobutyrate dehydrogenase [Solirubrobacteraceae bacterium]|jgi:3-hydroxyisobutyrate dehydrogenase|nr:3-hydroxyisobutyrate dehydrogenase [Solirubrobacteraceae bacterium]
MAHVAVLGTGIMGAPMARNIARAGHEVRAWNRTIEKVHALRDDGVEACEDPADAAEDADVVMTMLADADAVLEVARAAHLAEGQIWWQASTVGLDGIERCAQLAQQTGAVLVDGPVLGTRGPAEQGTLVVLASGPDDALRTCAPLFDAVGSRTLTVGEAGNGTRLKLAVNTWVLAVAEGTAETIALARALGLDPTLVCEALAGGTLDLPYFRMKAKLMLEDDFAPAFPVRLAAKDARLILEAAEREGADLPLARAVRDRLAEAAESGLAEEDVAATYRLAVPG